MRKISLCAVVAVAIAALPFEVAGQTLRGSPASVDRIHRQAINHRLRFYENAAAIRDAGQRGDLVRLEGNRDYALASVSFPYVLPATATFIARLAGQYRQACGERLVVTSATRPTSMRLANSVDKSVHPTGMAVDLRRPANTRCLNWLRTTLLTLEAAGVIEAVEERNPPHFHVAVFPTPYSRYVDARSGGAPVATTRLAATPNLAHSTPARSAAAQRTYQVRPGDSLWTIARRNNTTVARLQQANNLRSSRILAGQVLLIPDTR
jgi:LysM repeat protein